jgi:hypothetical protein
MDTIGRQVAKAIRAMMYKEVMVKASAVQILCIPRKS